MRAVFGDLPCARSDRRNDAIKGSRSPAPRRIGTTVVVVVVVVVVALPMVVFSRVGSSELSGFAPLNKVTDSSESRQRSRSLAMWSGRRDLNPRPPAPKAGALPDCATPRFLWGLTWGFP